MLALFKAQGFCGETIMSMHVYRFNLDEIGPASEFCEDLDILFSPYLAFFNDAAWSLDFFDGKLSDNVLARAREELFLDKIVEHSKSVPQGWTCPQYERITINETGDLILCC